MKKILWLLPLLLLISSCSKTNEEKAEALIKERLSSSLFHPETYKPVLTQLDSIFANLEVLEKIANYSQDLNELFRKQSRYEQEIEHAQTSMSIHAPNRYYNSEYSKTEYNQAKKELETAKRKLEKITPKIASTIEEIKKLSKQIQSDTFTGWIAYHRFTSMNRDNSVNVPGEVVFLLDPELTKCGDGIEKGQFEQLMKFISEITTAETEEDVKELFIDNGLLNY